MRAVLLVPAREWREKLLGDGPCGARPPVAALRKGVWSVAQPVDVACHLHSIHDAHEAYALALAWDGTGDDEGCLRLVRVLAERLSATNVEPDGMTAILHAHFWTEWENGDDGRGWPVAVGVGVEGVFWRLPLEEAPVPPEGLDAHAWALGRAARGLGTVVVVP